MDEIAHALAHLAERGRSAPTCPAVGADEAVGHLCGRLAGVVAEKGRARCMAENASPVRNSITLSALGASVRRSFGAVRA